MKTQLKRIIRLFVISVFCVAILFISLRLLVHFNFIGNSDGNSMEPTIKDREILLVNPFDTEPEPGKIMILKLSSLADADTNEDVSQKTSFLKRIKEINSDGCIWFEGDNTDELSTDSRDWGWFCPGEFEVEGTIMFKD